MLLPRAPLLVIWVAVAVAIHQTGAVPEPPLSRAVDARRRSLKVFRLQHVHGRAGAAER